jgi:SAM-dependent methyltransferase
MLKSIERVLEHPAVYAAWQAPFVAEKFAPVERSLKRQTVRRVLDVGCGPGTNAQRFSGADYVGVDINPCYLEVARARHKGMFVQADLASDKTLALGCFDTILVNSLLHHLDDQAVDALLASLATMLAPGGAVHVLELVRPDRLSLPSAMAALDRGRYARTLDRWRGLLDRYFDAVAFEPYTFGWGLWSMVYFQGAPRS